MTKAKIVGISWSHGRPRTELRRPSDGGTPALPEAAESVPMNDPKTGRFMPGNLAHRRRTLKTLAVGVSTLNPAACEEWLRPHVADGGTYAIELLGRFPDAALSRLVGATADAQTMFRAQMALAAKGDKVALGEARAWLREHRACLRELASLADVAKSGGGGDPNAAYAAAIAAEKAAR